MIDCKNTNTLDSEKTTLIKQESFNSAKTLNLNNKQTSTSDYDTGKTLNLREEGTKVPLKIRPKLENEKDRYKQIRILGKGAFGVVTLEEDQLLGRLVAVKRLTSSLLSDEEVIQRFIQEAIIAGKIQHPNVVNVYDITKDDDEIMIIMEFIGGGSISNLLKNKNVLSPISAVQYTLGILSGLDIAHSFGVFHRDIKPANIMLGFGNVPKITDFGVAYFPSEAGGLIPDKNERINVTGTPKYLAPELFKGIGATAKTDIFAAGCVFYEMLVGKPAQGLSSNLSWSEISESIEETKIDFDVEELKNLPKQILKILKKMLEKNHKKRYKNCTEIIKELNLALSALPLDETSTKNSITFTNSPKAILYDIITLLLLDRIITVEEREELNKRAEILGLSTTEVEEIEEMVREDMGITPLSKISEMKRVIINSIIESPDGKLDYLTKKKVNNIKNEFGISDIELEAIKSEILI